MAKKKITTYNRILKEFTRLNNKLPEDRKLSIKERRKIIKEEIYPKYKEVPKSKIRVRDIKKSITDVYDRLPPKELCDLNYVDLSEYAYIEWFALDETISELVPDCVYVKVSAGDYGSTRVINTRDYEYAKNGVRKIVEKIRPAAKNSSGKYIFSAYQKLRPSKKNDGTPENYYLDFILFEIDSKGREFPMESTEQTRFELPKDKKTKQIRNEVRKAIEDKLKQLKSKKQKVKRAKNTLSKNIKSFNLLTEKVEKLSTKKITPKNKSLLSKAKSDARRQFLRASVLLEKYYKEGKLTKIQYDSAIKKLFKDFNQ
jgi:hypothetical protein